MWMVFRAVLDLLVFWVSLGPCCQRDHRETTPFVQSPPPPASRCFFARHSEEPSVRSRLFNDHPLEHSFLALKDFL